MLKITTILLNIVPTQMNFWNIFHSYARAISRYEVGCLESTCDYCQIILSLCLSLFFALFH